MCLAFTENLRHFIISIIYLFAKMQHYILYVYQLSSNLYIESANCSNVLLNTYHNFLALNQTAQVTQVAPYNQ